MNFKTPIHMIMLALAVACATVVGLDFMLSATVFEPVSFPVVLIMLLLVAVAGGWSYPETYDTMGSASAGMLAGLAMFIAHLYTTSASWAGDMQYQLIFHLGILKFSFFVFTAVGTTAAGGWSVMYGWNSSKKLRGWISRKLR